MVILEGCLLVLLFLYYLIGGCKLFFFLRVFLIVIYRDFLIRAGSRLLKALVISNDMIILFSSLLLLSIISFILVVL